MLSPYFSPIDMSTIDGRIKGGAYPTEDDFLSDMRLMFSNCRQYNEEGSDIYEDAGVLERILVSKAKELGVVNQLGGRKAKGRQGGPRRKLKLSEKLRRLQEALRDHKDAKGRQLSLIFLRLPNHKEFPDYFEVIRKPIDFEMVGVKIKQNRYSAVEECLRDFVLMFDNACKYNEPDSQIYKDALVLQSLAHKTVRTMAEEELEAESGRTVAPPDVHAAVQDILDFIFVSMYNHQDSEER